VGELGKKAAKNPAVPSSCLAESADFGGGIASPYRLGFDPDLRARHPEVGDGRLLC
jgi:hypothetical protein